MDMTQAHLSTKRISSRVAPAWSAARMCRRVPAGLRLVQAAFNATPTSSTNFRGRIPLVHGFVVIATQASVHFGSQARRVSTDRSQGPLVAALSFAAVIESSQSVVVARRSPSRGGARPLQRTGLRQVL